MRYQATFRPQAWQNDHAIPVDPEGETTWDATAFVENLLIDGIGVGNLRENARVWLDETLARGDHDDILRTDPNAPEWVREWHGPFDTELTEDPEDE